MFLDPEFSEHLARLALYSRIWWGVAGIALLLIVWFGLRPGRRLALSPETAPLDKPAQLLQRLHRSDSALASLEYLMVLFPFLIIVMTVWQVAFMLNAQLGVGYSTFAAARSAVVQLPAEYGREKAGMLFNKGEAGATKWGRIRNAAVPGVLAVSPGDAKTALFTALLNGGGKELAVTETAARMSLMTLHYGDLELLLKNNRIKRLAVKSTYAQNMTNVFIDGHDRSGKDMTGKKNIPEKQDFSGTDVVTVTVRYVFWLNVPYVGRMLALAFAEKKDNFVSEFLDKEKLKRFPTMILSETISMKNWRPLRATEPCPT